MPAPIDRFFHPVLDVGALGTKPVGVSLDDRRYVLFRGKDGVAASFADECPHRGAPLSMGKVQDGCIVCPYHGWRFAPDGHGTSPTQARASCRADPLVVVEKHGVCWLGSSSADRASIPAFDEPDDFRFAGAIARVADAPLPLVIDNFAEDEHVPYVHTRLGWSDAKAPHVEHTCEAFDDRTEVTYVGPQRNSWIAPLLFLLPGDRFDNRWVHRFDPCRAIYTMRWTSPQGKTRPVALKVAIWFVPLTSATTRVQVFIFVQATMPGKDALFPVLARAAVALGKRELDDDARLLAMMKNAPISLEGRALGKFDRAVIHNRKLLERIYRGSSDVSSSTNRATSANEL